VATDPDLPSKKVFLHIGAPKSGTTFVQGVLWRNAGALYEAGVQLPGGSFAAHVSATRDLRGLVPEEDDPSNDWTGTWDRLVTEITESEAHTAVISNEVICAVDEEQAKRAVESLAPAEVHVIYSVRDLASLLPSEWQEYVKHRFHFDFDHWLREVVDGPRDQAAAQWFWKVHDIPEVLGRWTAVIPPERIHVVTMPRPGSPHDLLWRRFASVIGVDPEVADLTNSRVNASLSWTETELLRRVNHALDPEVPMWLYHRLVTDVLALKVMPGRGAPGRVALPPDRREWAEQEARRLAKSVEEAGYSVTGDLDELLPTPPAEGRGESTPPNEGELLDASTHAILGLLERIAMLREEVGDLNREKAEQRRTALPKVMARHLSERSKAVWKMRVGYWHLMERVRGVEPPMPELDENGDLIEDEDLGPALSTRTLRTSTPPQSETQPEAQSEPQSSAQSGT